METPTKKRKINKSKKSLDFFEFVREDEAGKKWFSCNHCKKEVNGTKTSNLASHLRIHENIYDKVCADIPSIEYKRKKLLLNCIELVTVNGRPFQSLCDSAVVGFNEDLLNELEKVGREFNMRDPHLIEVKDGLKDIAEKVRQKISALVKNRCISLLVDIVTKRGRSLLGVSIQFIAGGKVHTRSIGMIELHESHTGMYLAELIIKRLNELGIGLKQIITITTDNGANVLKMVRDMEAYLREKVVETEPPPTPVKSNQNCEAHQLHVLDEEAIEREIEAVLATNENLTDDEVLGYIFDEVERVEYTEEDGEPTENDLRANENLLAAIQLNMEDVHGLNVMWEVKGINCAAHTLQLAIGGAIDSTAAKNRNVIKLCSRVAQFMRNQTTKYVLDKAGIDYKKPRIEVTTRWCSLYLMVSFITFGFCIDTIF